MDRLQRSEFRVDLDRVSDADRHAAHGRPASCRWALRIDRRRVRGRHLLGRRRGADRVVAGGRGLHAVPWPACCCPRATSRNCAARHAPRRLRPAAVGTTGCDLCALRRLGRSWSTGAWVIGSPRRVGCWPAPACSLVQQQFFPTASRPELLVELRHDAKARRSPPRERQVKQLEAAWRRTRTSSTSPPTPAPARRASTCRSAGAAQPGLRAVRRQDGGIEQRERVRARLMELFAKDEALPDVEARVTRLEFGPPVGFPVQFRVIGPDKARCARSPSRCATRCARARCVRDTQLDWNEQVALGAGPSRPGQGAAAGSVRRRHPGPGADGAGRRAGHADPPRRRTRRRGRARHARASASASVNIGSTCGLHAQRRHRAAVAAGPVEPSFEEPVLWRRNRDMALTVRSDVVDGVQGPLRDGADRPVAAAHRRSLPAGLPHRGRRRRSRRATRPTTRCSPCSRRCSR